MVDQEGGLVKRLAGAPTASAAEMGARGAAFSRDQGARTAANLRDVGINVDLAPVLDVARPAATSPRPNAASARPPARVAATAVPFAAALQAGGVAATGKHFPGLRRARVNTDVAVQRVGLSKAELRRVDEAPYRSYVAARRRDGDAEHGDLPGLLAEAGGVRAADRDRRAAPAPRLRGGLDHRLARQRRGRAPSAARPGPGSAAARAGTDLLLFTDLEAGARAEAGLLRGPAVRVAPPRRLRNLGGPGPAPAPPARAPAS